MREFDLLPGEALVLTLPDGRPVRVVAVPLRRYRGRRCMTQRAVGVEAPRDVAVVRAELLAGALPGEGGQGEIVASG